MLSKETVLSYKGREVSKSVASVELKMINASRSNGGKVT